MTTVGGGGPCQLVNWAIRVGTPNNSISPWSTKPSKGGWGFGSPAPGTSLFFLSAAGRQTGLRTLIPVLRDIWAQCDRKESIWPVLLSNCLSRPSLIIQKQILPITAEIQQPCTSPGKFYEIRSRRKLTTYHSKSWPLEPPKRGLIVP